MIDQLLHLADVATSVDVPNLKRFLTGVDVTKLLRNGNWWDAIWAALIQEIGRTTLLASLGTMYFVSLWWYTGSIFPPAIVLTLYGGTLILGAPAPIAIAGGLVVTLALAFSYYAIFGRRF